MNVKFVRGAIVRGPSEEERAEVNDQKYYEEDECLFPISG